MSFGFVVLWHDSHKGKYALAYIHISQKDLRKILVHKLVRDKWTAATKYNIAKSHVSLVQNPAHNLMKTQDHIVDRT